MNGQVAALDRVGELVGIRFAEHHIDIADVPFVQSLRGQTFCQLEPEVSLVVHRKGISEIRGVVGVVIIVTVIAE